MKAKSSSLPDFPWDSLTSAKEVARSYPEGMVDLSVGTPVDATATVIQDALIAASNSPGYPTVWGTPDVRQAIINYLMRRFSVMELSEPNVMPCIGTKELVGWLPTMLGLDSSDLVVFPALAYPTYEVGAKMAGCQTQRATSPDEVSGDPAVIWINSPANPTGEILSKEQLRAWVEFARAKGAILASDECYAEFGWDAEPESILHPDVCGGSTDGLLVVQSLSKRSNLAGYRAGFVAGDASIIQELVGLRRHLGMMVPAPVQQAMIAALGDQVHVHEQRMRYLTRRVHLITGLEAAGFEIAHSEGSLYLWATRGEDCWQSVNFLAEHGILVAPGSFYGPLGQEFVRVALTGSDEAIDQATERLFAYKESITPPEEDEDS